MSRAVVDSNVLYGRFNRQDELHEAAREIFDAMDRTALPRGLIVSIALPEVLNPAQKRAGETAATEFLDRLQRSSGFTIEWLSRESYEKALGEWKSRSGVEFTDVALVQFMRANDVEYIYSFDDDFDEFDGITRLNSAVDPFEP